MISALFLQITGFKKLGLEKKICFCNQKDKDKLNIMVLKFIFLFEYFNLALLTPKKRQKVMKKTSLMHIEAIEMFEYKKNHNSY